MSPLLPAVNRKQSLSISLTSTLRISRLFWFVQQGQDLKKSSLYI